MIDTSDLDAVIGQLREGVASDAVGDAAHPAIAAMADAVHEKVRAQAAPHRRSGKLDAAIDVSVAGEGVETVGRVTVGDVGNILVSGQRPHLIRPLGGRVIALGSPAVGFAAYVNHPGVAPDPFVARGVAAAAGELAGIGDDAARHTAAEIAARLEG